VDVAGAWVPITPSQWAAQRDVVIDFRLGYGERDNRAREYLELGTMLAQDPAVAHLYSANERYNVYKTVFETKGHRDISLFLKNPQTTPPPQPDPAHMVELQLRQQEITLNERKQTLAEQKVRDASALDQYRAQMDEKFRTMEMQIKAMDEERKQAETRNRIMVAETEMALAVSAEQRAPEANIKSTAIISPNG